MTVEVFKQVFVKLRPYIAEIVGMLPIKGDQLNVQVFLRISCIVFWSFLKKQTTNLWSYVLVVLVRASCSCFLCFNCFICFRHIFIHINHDVKHVNLWNLLLNLWNLLLNLWNLLLTFGICC